MNSVFFLICTSENSIFTWRSAFTPYRIRSD